VRSKNNKKKSVKLGMADALDWDDRMFSPCLLKIIAGFESVSRSAFGGVL
jgi:hypothetical protein